MKRVTQKDVTWVKKDPKTKKGGYLALRSDTSKPFTGVVTGVKKGTTAASKSGEAVYRGGKNIINVAKRSKSKTEGAMRAKQPANPASAPKTPTRITQGAGAAKKATPSVGRGEYAKYAAARRESKGRNTSVGPLDAFLKSAVSKFNPANRFAAPPSKPGAPKKGDKKTMLVNGKKKTVTFNGKRWV